MSKEINEQNITAKTCVKEYVDQLRKDINLYNFPINPKDIKKIILIGDKIMGSVIKKLLIINTLIIVFINLSCFRPPLRVLRPNLSPPGGPYLGR